MEYTDKKNLSRAIYGNCQLQDLVQDKEENKLLAEQKYKLIEKMYPLLTLVYLSNFLPRGSWDHCHKKNDKTTEELASWESSTQTSKPRPKTTPLGSSTQAAGSAHLPSGVSHCPALNWGRICSPLPNSRHHKLKISSNIPVWCCYTLASENYLFQ